MHALISRELLAYHNFAHTDLQFSYKYGARPSDLLVRKDEHSRLLGRIQESSVKHKKYSARVRCPPCFGS